ncbi:MAG: hypothetical protein FWC92_07440 [Defluviitaleaceae bacterium]|nr:hypothetical protein [Defluviitaleaceae bacterium]
MKKDKTLFEELCEIQATHNEIKAALECNEADLDKWCLETYNENYDIVYKRFSDMGKDNLLSLTHRFKVANTK